MSSAEPTRSQEHPVRFGYFLVPNAADPLLETARRVEEVGLDYVGIQDHPYQARYVETWALMAMIAAATTSLRIFPDVANLPLRPPAVMAKTAATIDVLSGGRFELGLGAGAFWEAIEAYGGGRRTPGDSLRALEEAMDVIRLVWSGERNLRFEGEHYRLSGARGGPVPAHPIGIWLGVYGPRALALAGRTADGWVPSRQGDLQQLHDMSRRLDDAAEDAGRSPGAIRRVLNVSGRVTDGSSEGPFNGPVDQWVEDLESLVTGDGFDTFLFWGEGEDQLDRFGREVVPAARERLGQAGRA
jgi:alkanesulfonate monooxygenase SsuD/methylene tetrahydromethanopterin reductase-like flavin-dependent oxidoreductase (luciferase family)